MTQQNRSKPNRRQQNRKKNQDWAQQVDWQPDQGPYRDYGWESDESVLPEFRDPSIHLTRQEQDDVQRMRQEEFGAGRRTQRGPYAGVGPQGYQRSDDSIFEEVCQRITQHGQIDASHMKVNVKKGEVTLDGDVDSRQTKKMVENIADQVHGVKDIHNNLHIQHQGQANQTRSNQGGSSRQGGKNRKGARQTSNKNRVDRVGDTGVYPVSGPWPDDNAPVQNEAGWGQGERGAEGYQDSGRSELNIPPEKNE